MAVACSFRRPGDELAYPRRAPRPVGLGAHHGRCRHRGGPGAAHHILIPVTAASADIELSPVVADTAVAAQRSAGLGEKAAEQAGRLARCSLQSMRRSLANKPELHTPDWESPTRTLRALLMASRSN